jgi:hypothetical protein
MDNGYPTVEDELAAIVALWTGVPDHGALITRERFTKNKEGYADLFTALETNGTAHGVLIQWVGFRQSKVSLCGRRRTDIFDIECLYPYNDKIAVPLTNPVTYTTSDALNKILQQRLDDALCTVYPDEPPFDLRMSRNFPLANVEHGLLQAISIPFLVEQWGDGTDARVAHYNHYALEVTATRVTHATP